MKKILLFVGLAVFILGVVIYVILKLFLFPNVYLNQNLVVHYRSNVTTDKPNLKIASQKLRLSAVFDSTKSYQIYLCPSVTSFNILAPFNQRSNATVYRSINTIFLRPDMVRINGNAESPQRKSTMAGLIATTVTMTELDDNSHTSSAEDWKKIGYAEYIGGDSVQNAQTLCKFIGQKQSPLLESIKDQLAVTYLMREKRIGLDSLLSSRIPRDSVLSLLCSPMIKTVPLS